MPSVIMINYTIIIPHKNIPSLLCRCLKSIPRRDDIQVIVVDDNSSEETVNFEDFPGLDDSRVICLFLKDSKGAGNARNIGMQHAIGKWILFADADDLFEPNAFDEFDRYKNSNVDVILFKVTSKYSNNLELNADRDYYNPYIDDFEKGKINQVELLLKSVSPWAKMVRHDFLVSYKICFEETFLANDVFWTSQVAINAKLVAVSSAPVYCITCREGSLVKRRNEQALYIRYGVEKRNCKYLISHGLKKYEYPLAIEYLSWARSNGVLAFCRFVKHAIQDKTLYVSRQEGESRFNYRHPFLYCFMLMVGLVK